MSSGYASVGWQATTACLNNQALQHGLENTQSVLPFKHAAAVIVTGDNTHIISSKALRLHEQILHNTLLLKLSFKWGIA